jgi:hypothetical protein
MPRPDDPEYYLVTRSGTYICRNHAFFASDVRTTRGPSSLQYHTERCWIRYPKLSRSALEFAVGFFDRVYQLHRSEAVVLLFWDLKRKRYKLWVPDQKPTVWESSGGYRSAMDVAYQVPVPLPVNHLLVGDIHSHADLGAYASQQDRDDEFYRDGVHVVVGRIDAGEPPDFHLEIAVDGQRFLLQSDQFLQGYRRRRRIVPQAWLDQVKVKVKRSWWVSSHNTWEQDNRSDQQHYDSNWSGGSSDVKLLKNESTYPEKRKKNRWN